MSSLNPNSQSIQNNQNNQHLLGKLTVLAYKGKEKPLGEAPTNEELALLVENKLSFNRKQEIQSHLNCNRVLFQQWLNLLAITTNTAKQTDKKVTLLSQIKLMLSSWKGITGGLTSATLATILVVQLVDTKTANLQPNIENQAPNATTKTKEPATKLIEPTITSKEQISKPQFISPDKRAIAAGIQNLVSQSTVNQNNINKGNINEGNINEGNRLASQLDLSIAIDKQGSALTEKLYQNYFHLGELIATTAMQCQSQRDEPLTNSEAIKQLLNKLQKESYLPLPLLLQSIGKNSTSRTAQCSAIEKYLLTF